MITTLITEQCNYPSWPCHDDYIRTETQPDAKIMISLHWKEATYTEKRSNHRQYCIINFQLSLNSHWNDELNSTKVHCQLQSNKLRATTTESSNHSHSPSQLRKVTYNSCWLSSTVSRMNTMQRILCAICLDLQHIFFHNFTDLSLWWKSFLCSHLIQGMKHQHRGWGYGCSIASIVPGFPQCPDWRNEAGYCIF